MENQLIKELIPIQIDGSSPDFTSNDRDIVCSAKFQIHLLFHILVKADAHVWLGRRDERKGLASQMRQGMVDELRFVPGDFAQIIEFHRWPFLPQAKKSCSEKFDPYRIIKVITTQ